MKHNVPVQSLIDHIKTATDVDPWAKEMAEELLKEQKAVVVYDPGAYCPKCGWMLYPEDHPHHCGNCGQAVKWK